MFYYELLKKLLNVRFFINSLQTLILTTEPNLVITYSSMKLYVQQESINIFCLAVRISNYNFKTVNYSHTVHVLSQMLIG